MLLQGHADRDPQMLREMPVSFGNALRRGAQMLLGLAGFLLAACDDGTVITRVQVWGDARSYFTTAGAAGVATEVHGTPFARVSAEEVVSRLRLPPGMPQEIRFRLVPQGEQAEGVRLLLVFNRTDVPDSMRDCRRSARGQPLPVAPNPAQEVGFTVTASLCDAEARVATAHMEATKTRADDPEEFARVMRLLLIEMTRNDD
jgi:hypothetical protein